MIEDFKNFPKFFVGICLGLISAALTEIEVFLIFILAIFLSFVTGPMIAISACLTLYLLFRMISQVANLFSAKMDLIARVLDDE